MLGLHAFCVIFTHGGGARRWRKKILNSLGTGAAVDIITLLQSGSGWGLGKTLGTWTYPGPS